MKIPVGTIELLDPATVDSLGLAYLKAGYNWRIMTSFGWSYSKGYITASLVADKAIQSAGTKPLHITA
jgi:hypothetical protein